MAFQFIDISAIPPRHPVAAFAAFWRDAADGSAFAPWSAFDAVEHPRVLPWIILLKTEDGPSIIGGPRLRYIVCGTGLTDMLGFSYQGKLFGEDLPLDAAVRRVKEFERVMAGSGPLFSQTELPIPGKDFYEVYRGVFAFTGETGAVDRICAVIAPATLEI